MTLPRLPNKSVQRHDSWTGKASGRNNRAWPTHRRFYSGEVPRDNGHAFSYPIVKVDKLHKPAASQEAVARAWLTHPLQGLFTAMLLCALLCQVSPGQWLMVHCEG